MDIISHVVYPVLAAQSVNIFHNLKHKESLFKWKPLLLIGICGGLPDLISPHTSLEARYNSVSHNIWFLLVLAIISALLALKIPKHRTLICFCFFAAVFHLLCDLFAGGINLYGPFGMKVIGRHYLPFQYWIPFDLTGILFLFIPFLYHKSPVRARIVVLTSGCVLAVCGALLIFSGFESEWFFLKKIPASKINMAQLKQAQRAWNDLMVKGQDGAFEPLSSEFTDGMRQGLAPQSQKQFFQQMRSSWGDYRGITFVEAKTGRFYYPRMIVYRFKGTFSKTIQPSSIGIVFDHNGKISGILLRDKWNDKLL
jgi:hypothetical protein